VTGVSLVEVSQDDIGRVSGISYFVVPEPAATAKVNALTTAGTTYTNVASLQSLYGEGGYPQAVLVAKNSLIENDGAFLNSFLSEYAGTKAWLTAQTSYAEIVTEINSKGGTSLKAPMLTPTVVANCNIDFKKAADEKQAVLSYMTKIAAVNASMYGSCEDAFFCDVDSIAQTTNASKTTVSVYMPDGAPALSMAKMMCGNVSLSKELDFHVVPANSINSNVTNNDETKNADLCVLPVNAAAKLLGSGNKYKLLGTVTHGNLFIISSDGTPVTASNIARKLDGQKVGVVNLSAVPGLTFKMILDKYKIPYSQGGV
ncbi:MAG: hypothetical protein K2N47_01865, partial [Clostridia bacterium]|nr:hypothetical protein [Clostridia bacterium]